MDWTRGPPVLVGEKVLWSKSSLNKPKSGVVKWIGNISDISSDWCVGIELDETLPSIGGDGFWKDRKLFECRSSHGLLVPIEEIQKLCSKIHSRSTNVESYSHFKLDNTKLKDFIPSHLLDINNKNIQLKKTYLEARKIKEFSNNIVSDSGLGIAKENQKCGIAALGDPNNSLNELKSNNQEIKKSPRRKSVERKNSEQFEKNLSSHINKLNCHIISEARENSQSLDSKISVHEFIKNMNEIAGYFKEIKEEDEIFEKQEQTGNITHHETNDSGHSKPKKLFSFLKWFNKKHNKNEANLKLFRDSSVTSSPIFPRKETSSCESIDTLFSTQTVRSFAYIPPTQYIPSAPPLDYDKSSYENVVEDLRPKKTTLDETEPIYDRRKKIKAPEPPRLSRENSLPTTLEFKKTEEVFDGVKTYHRRTVSESFKDKKAGAYCHVQGKKKAPPPPAPLLYPNLQKLNNQYPSLYKKKKPAPPPPDLNFENQKQNTPSYTLKDFQKQDTNQPAEKPKTKKSKDINHNGDEEKGMKINQKSKDRLTKDVSLSPLPSRPWYKRNHRDSTGNKIIRKDFLRGFDKKTNKETDDWMPEVGFPKRSPSIESSHNKFNIFSKLDKTEEKKKEEKRKSQISILTNISELDREAAEILKKEQAQEKQKVAANDAKYYSSKENDVKISEFAEKLSNLPESSNKHNKNMIEKNKSKSEMKNDAAENNEVPPAYDYDNIKHVKTVKDQSVTDEQPKIKADKENNLNTVEQSKDNIKQNLLSSDVETNLSNSSSQTPLPKISKPSQNSSQARLNYFNVQNKETNYLNEPWVCKKCTLENPGWRVFCEICKSVKPMFSAISPPKIPQSEKRGDEKETNKSDSVSVENDKPKEIKLAVENPNKTKYETFDIAENKATSTESLDELRKRRMMFFASKLDSLDESNRNEPDPNKIKLKEILKEMRDSLPKGEDAGETPETDKKHLKRKPEEKNTKEMIKTKSEEKAGSNVFKEEKEKSHENPEKSDILKDESDETSNLNQHGVKDVSKQKEGYGNQSPPHKPQELAEAYIVTKTIVLEDIIIQKPDRARKAMLQAKPSLSNSSETKVLRPPPRTKKTNSGIITESVQERETKSCSKNCLSKTEENFRAEDIEELTTRLTQAKGLADFRADIESMSLNTEMNTVAVNRLLRKLETAINCGDHFVAAGLAKELALMKINCSVTRQVTPTPSTSTITADLYIEDKVSHQGPIALKVSPTMSLLQLKKKVQEEFNIPLEVQRWILDKKLATDDSKTLEDEGVKADYCPLFLYLVAPGNQKTNPEASSKSEKNSELKLHQDSQQNEASPEIKKRYYNYEEDHYSYCDDSEDDSKNSSTSSSNQTKSGSPKKGTELSETDLKKTQIAQKMNKVEKVPLFDLKTKNAENNVEKELKYISVNSVKQKIEQLNKTFAENAKAVKPPLRSSRLPETWKCGACSVVNLPERLSCLSCNAKKVPTGQKNKKPEDKKKLLRNESVKKENVKPPETANDNVHYKTLMELQDADLVPNSEPFSCSICMEDYAPGKGVTLKDCLHTFCRSCLESTVQFSEDAEVKCPYLDDTYSCPSVLQQREIKALVSHKIFEKHLAKSVKEAENKIENAFHCKSPDCKGWCIYEDNVNEFRCPVCKSTNCLTCQAIHNGIDCREYQERMKLASETDVDANKTRNMLNEMVEKGEAMACPKCQVVLMKKWGCDWLRCSMCKTEICWVTRGFRWGPEGKGDTSGGCKCGVNGVKCHPKCNYCH